MEEIKYENAKDKEWRANQMIDLMPPIRATVRLKNGVFLAGVGFSKEEAKKYLLKAIEKYARA